MSTKAQEKEAHKVAAWLDDLAKQADNVNPPIRLEGNTHNLATQLRGLARRIREGEHRQ